MTTSTQTPAAGMTRLPAAGTKHGTLSCGKYRKCKRPECIEAVRAYRRTVHRKKGYGTWQPLVDAEPARRHLLALHEAGYSYKVIADYLGKHTAGITGIVYDLSPHHPRRKRIRPQLAEQILGLTEEKLTPGMLPAAGTARRLRALTAVGWPNRIIGEHLGVAAPRISQIAKQQIVTHAVAQAVAECYRQLSGLSPADHGVTPATIVRLRNLAERHAWRDPVWWEDMGHIDDPTFDPSTAERPLNFHEQAQLRREEILHLASYGATPVEIAARLGLGRDFVVARLRELREVAA